MEHREKVIAAVSPKVDELKKLEELATESLKGFMRGRQSLQRALKEIKFTIPGKNGEEDIIIPVAELDIDDWMTFWEYLEAIKTMPDRISILAPMAVPFRHREGHYYVWGGTADVLELLEAVYITEKCKLAMDEAQTGWNGKYGSYWQSPQSNLAEWMEHINGVDLQIEMCRNALVNLRRKMRALGWSSFSGSWEKPGRMVWETLHKEIFGTLPALENTVVLDDDDDDEALASAIRESLRAALANGKFERLKKKRRVHF